MKPDRGRVLGIVAASAWLAASAGVTAQPSSPPPIPAVVIRNSSDTPRNVLVHHIQRGTISLSFEGSELRGQIPATTIKTIRFAFDERATEGQNAAREERYDVAAENLHPYVVRLMPYLAIADNNVSEVTDPYVLAVQQLGRLDRLRAYYGMVMEHGDEGRKRSAAAWLAYLDVRDGHLERAQQAFDELPAFETGEEGYLLRHIGLSRIFLERQDVRNAVDHAAKVTAACGIDHILHPEALVLSAQCYEGLAAGELARLGEEREAKLKRALLIERVKVGREMEAKADAEGLPEPTEQQILQGVDEEKVEGQVPLLPALPDLKLSQTAQRLYLFVERVFPDTPWGKQAMDKVLPATREGDEQGLTMAARPSGTDAAEAEDSGDGGGPADTAGPAPTPEP